jgi:hypothetical protein
MHLRGFGALLARAAAHHSVVAFPPSLGAEMNAQFDCTLSADAFAVRGGQTLAATVFAASLAEESRQARRSGVQLDAAVFPHAKRAFLVATR